MPNWLTLVFGALCVAGGAAAVALGFPQGDFAVTFGLGLLTPGTVRAVRNVPKAWPLTFTALALTVGACGGGNTSARTVCEYARDGACAACSALTSACPGVRGSSQPAGVDTVGGEGDPCDPGDVECQLGAPAPPLMPN